MRGSSNESRLLAHCVRECALLSPVRERLASTLDTSRRIHTVSLYLALTASDVTTEVQLNGEADIALGGSLRTIPLFRSRNFVSVRQNLIVFGYVG